MPALLLIIWYNSPGGVNCNANKIESCFSHSTEIERDEVWENQASRSSMKGEDVCSVLTLGE